MGFYLNGNKYYRSNFGGFAGVLIYLITIICGIIFSRELWIKRNPKLNTSTLYISPTKVYYPDNIFFMISMSIDSKPFVNEKIYRVVGYIRTKINGTEEALNTKNISMDLCSNVFDETYKYYDSIKDLNLSNFYCISLDKTKKNGIEKDELFLNEFWGKDGFQMLQIKIYNCTAIAENKDECESNNIIKEKLESPIITYYTLKNYIDTNNYENPYVRGIQETFYYVSYKKFISATEYLKHVQIHSDVGLIFNTEETKADSTVDSLVDYFETDQEDGKIFTMTLQLTNNMDIYGRTYYKIQDLGADIGAIYGVLRLIFSTLMEFYNTSKLFTNIINTFFSIKEEYKPHSKDKKTFINLRAKFFKGIKLNNSFEENNYIINQLNESRNNNRFVKFKSSLNTGNIKKNKSRNKNLFTEENTSNYKSTENINNSNNVDHIKIKKNYIIKTSYKKKKENNKIKIKFSYIDKLFCLYIIDLCRNKVNKYSYYNLFYKGKDYLIKILDVKNYLVINSFVQMFFLINRREKKHIFNYITKPILSCNYVGTKLENEKNLTI